MYCTRTNKKQWNMSFVRSIAHTLYHCLLAFLWLTVRHIGNKRTHSRAVYKAVYTVIAQVHGSWFMIHLLGFYDDNTYRLLYKSNFQWMPLQNETDQIREMRQTAIQNLPVDPNLALSFLTSYLFEHPAAQPKRNCVKKIAERRRKRR